LTGEARFHRALEAETMGIGLLTAGHYATERPGVEELAEKIAVAFPAVTVWPSADERDPLRLVVAENH
jgi:putative NIF3 family GTP cyclohydrolase 1 type 2